MREVHKITDHKPLISIFKKDVAMLSQWIQQILLKFTSIGSNFYIKPDQKYLLQIGCHVTIAKKMKMSLSET